MAPVVWLYIDGTSYSYYPEGTWEQCYNSSNVCDFKSLIIIGSDGYIYSVDGTKRLVDESQQPIHKTDTPDYDTYYYLVAFTPPAAHKAIVGGTTYEIVRGKTLIGGTGSSIVKGRTLVGGTGYDISFAPPGTPLGDLPVGQSVWMPVNGVRTEFLVVHQGLPGSTIQSRAPETSPDTDTVTYDTSCEGTWLLMKDIYETRQWHSTYINDYKASTIHTYLNSTFLTLFDTDIRTKIKTVSIPYVNGNGRNGVVESGSNGLSTQIFLLSGYEVGWTQSNNSRFFVDGSRLSYFNDMGTTDSRRVGYMGGTATPWWLRSAFQGDDRYPLYVQANGLYRADYCVMQYGIRPAMVMHSYNTYVDSDYNIIAAEVDQPSSVSFTVLNYGTYTARNGMTWGEWCSSEYNTIGATTDGSGIRIGSAYIWDKPSSTYVRCTPTDTIRAGYSYTASISNPAAP